MHRPVVVQRSHCSLPLPFPFPSLPFSSLHRRRQLTDCRSLCPSLLSPCDLCGIVWPAQRRTPRRPIPTIVCRPHSFRVGSLRGRAHTQREEIRIRMRSCQPWRWARGGADRRPRWKRRVGSSLRLRLPLFSFPPPRRQRADRHSHAPKGRTQMCSALLTRVDAKKAAFVGATALRCAPIDAERSPACIVLLRSVGCCAALSPAVPFFSPRPHPRA